MLVTPRPMSLVRIGARFAIALLGAIVASGSCEHSSPTGPISPTQATLNGRWVGTLANQFGGPDCLGDWSRLVLTLQSTGSDELVTNDGQYFAVTDMVNGGFRNLEVIIPAPSSMCGSVILTIDSIQLDGTGAIVGFSGSVTGRCCNTIVNNFTFTRG